LFRLVKFVDIGEYLNGTNQAIYLERYLSHLNSETCIIEDNYYDKDFLIDYQKFYSRSFKKYPKVTERIHFFKNVFQKEKFIQAITNNEESFLEELKNEYQGFVVIKPIKDRRGRKLIGRTIIETYPDSEEGIQRKYIKQKSEVSLYGVPIDVHSIPFQSQDRGVSACATIALWTAVNIISKKFEVPILSPFEITDLSTPDTFSTFPSSGRVFPQSGLNLGQMINCFRRLNLETEVIKLANVPNDKIIRTAIRAYLETDIPIIAIMTLTQPGDFRRHASVITGYQSIANRITELYAHDDQIGPYSRIKPIDAFRTWNIKEYSDLGFVVKPEYLIVPLYHKIRLTFNKMYLKYLDVQNEIQETLSEDASIDLTQLRVRLFLKSIQEYKKELIRNDITGKSDVMTFSFPRYIWIIRRSYQDRVLYDQIFDGTAVWPNELKRVEYEL